jgi:transposase
VVLDAIFYVVRGGIAWPLLPREFPPHDTVYGVFTRWKKAGAWKRIHDTLRNRLRVDNGRDYRPTAAVIDSQTVRGADTVAANTAGYDAGKKTKGRKRHIAVDTGGLILAIVVTAASIQDRDGAFRLPVALRNAFSTITLVWADGGYAGRLVTWAKNILDTTVEIVKRTNEPTGFTVLPRRWVVERTFGWIVKHRRCIRDYETHPDTHETMIYIAMISLMTRQLAQHPT